MEHSYISKLNIFIKILLNYIICIIYIRTYDFKKFKRKLEVIKINKNKGDCDNLLRVYAYERKIANFFRIKKCLTSSSCLFKTYRELGFSPKIIIGVANDNNFASHAWVEVDGLKLLHKSDFEIILKI